MDSPPSGIALKFDKLATDDDDAGSKTMTPLSEPSDTESGGKSGYPSPMTDAGYSGTFDMMDGGTSASSDNKSPRQRKRGSSTNKYRRKLKTSSAGDVAAASTKATDADVDTDVEGSSPNDSNEEGEGEREDKRHDQKQQQQQPTKPPRTPAKAQTPQQDAGLSLSGTKQNSRVKLMRVTSFSAFSNAPLYDTEDSSRYGRLKSEKYV